MQSRAYSFSSKAVATQRFEWERVYFRFHAEAGVTVVRVEAPGARLRLLSGR
jgi:hypothetical protein